MTGAETPPWTVLASGLEFPEGPAFHPDGSLWCVELKGGSLVRLEGGIVTRHLVGGAPNGLAFHGAEAWFCDADGGAVRRLQADGRTVTAIGGADRPLDRPNDLAFDPSGTLVVTCPGNSRTEPTGTVLCRRAHGTCSQVADGLFFPNGLAFTPDGRELIVAETYRQRLWRGDWDAAAAAWTNVRVWAETGGPIGPDGMAFGDDGLLYVAVYGQGHIDILGTDGVRKGSLPTPGCNPTNVCFDPSGALGLVLTEADSGQILSCTSFNKFES